MKLTGFLGQLGPKVRS